MLTKIPVKYTDLDGVEREEVCCFNISKSELIKMRFSVDGGMDVMLDKIIKSNDSTTMMRVFDQIFMAAYGEKSDDGKRFMKNDTIRENFANSVAYDIIFTDLISDEKKMADFVNSILPELPKENS